MPNIPFQWIPRKADTGENSQTDQLARNPLDELLRVRSISSENMERFLQPRLKHLSDPFLIPNMEAAVVRILQAIDQNENVCVFGDYDVDGISSVTLMATALEAYGIIPQTFIPRRGNEGYGLTLKSLERCLSKEIVPDLIICVDCGTVSNVEIAYLKEQGIDVIVVDHHEPSAEASPDCVALVNPKCGDKFTYLCAAGVVFKVAHALIKRRNSDLDLKAMLELTAIATVADIVPLVDENRILVRHGLRQLRDSKNLGLLALKAISKISAYPTSSDVSFRLAPRINAAGRMDEPDDALKMLRTNDAEEALELAEQLDSHNKERQGYEALIKKEAAAFLEKNFDAENDPVIVIGSRDWHHGVVGIVASRLMRQYHKPAFVISIDENGIGKGSGRSIDGLSLVDAIRHCDEHLISGGGHDMAAGLSIREENIDAFREKFSQFVLETTSEEQRRPKLTYDIAIGFENLTLDFLESYELIQPFGNANPQPVFISEQVDLARDPFEMKNKHLRLNLLQNGLERSAVYFGGGEHELPPLPWDIAFTIDRNEFRGTTSLQIVIKDIRAAVTK